MLKIPCENLPAWRIREVAAELTGSPVAMPIGHQYLDASTWLDMFLANDGEDAKPTVVLSVDTGSNLSSADDGQVLAHIQAHPDCTTKDISFALNAPVAELRWNVKRLREAGLIEKSGEVSTREARRNVATWRATEGVSE